MSGLTSVSLFLISTLFSLLTFVLWARVFIRYFSISPFSPLSQSIFNLTNPVITPIQRHITRSKGTHGPYDITCLLVLVICTLLKYTLLNLLILHRILSPMDIIFYTMIDMIVQPCNILFYLIIVRTIMSWINPLSQSPLASLLVAMTEPLLRFIRQKLPTTGMIDFSPFIAIIGLKCIEIFCLSVLPYRII